MKEILKNKRSLIVIILILVGLFYWFQIRPAKIRKFCGTEPVLLYNKNETSMTYQEFYNFDYQKCLNQHGLK